MLSLTQRSMQFDLRVQQGSAAAAASGDRAAFQAMRATPDGEIIRLDGAVGMQPR
jgi:hypothetical protein